MGEEGCPIERTHCWDKLSLIPRSSPPSSFGSCIEWKNGEGRPGPFYHVNGVIGRQSGGGVAARKNAFRACVLWPEQ